MQKRRDMSFLNAAPWIPASTSVIPSNPANGGMFTGKPCNPAWANIPITPTEASFNRVLRQHNDKHGTPAEVEFHLVSGHRPGNNDLTVEGPGRNDLVLLPTNQLYFTAD